MPHTEIEAKPQTEIITEDPKQLQQILTRIADLIPENRAMSQVSQIEDRLIELLGMGYSNEQAANACGVTVSSVSQLMSKEDTAAKVAELRAAALTQANEIDCKWSKLENRVLDKLEKSIDWITDTGDLLKAAALLNRRLDRGVKAAPASTSQNTVVQLNIPTLAIQNLVVNSHQHVIQAGAQSLITIQSGNMKGLLNETSDPTAPDLGNSAEAG